MYHAPVKSVTIATWRSRGPHCASHWLPRVTWQDIPCHPKQEVLQSYNFVALLPRLSLVLASIPGLIPSKLLCTARQVVGSPSPLFSGRFPQGSKTHSGANRGTDWVGPVPILSWLHST